MKRATPPSTKLLSAMLRDADKQAEAIDYIASLVEKVGSQEKAALALKVFPRTFYRWTKANKALRDRLAKDRKRRA